MNAVTKKTISYFEGMLGISFRPVGAGIASENFSHHIRVRGYLS